MEPFAKRPRRFHPDEKDAMQDVWRWTVAVAATLPPVKTTNPDSSTLYTVRS